MTNRSTCRRGSCRRSASPLDSPPPSVVVEVEFGARSRRGPLRSVNDDHYLIMRLGRHQETLMTSLPERDCPDASTSSATAWSSPTGWAAPAKPPAGSPSPRSCTWRSTSADGTSRIDEPIAEEMHGSRATVLPERRFHAPAGQPRHQPAPSADDADGRLHRRHRAVLRARRDIRAPIVFRDDELMQLTRDHTLDRERPGKAAHRGRAPPARGICITS